MSMTDEIDALLSDIDELQKTNMYLGCAKYKHEFRQLLRVICIGLIYIYVATHGMFRRAPTGHDLLLYMYVAYLYRQ
jgi:gluconate kinase